MILVDCGSIRQELRVTRTMQQRYAQDWPSIPASLARTQALHPQWIYPGHGDSPLPGTELQNLRVH